MVVMVYREITEKDNIYKNVWCCARQREFMYRGTPRGQREWETVQMCLKIAKWERFQEDRSNIFNPSKYVEPW